MNTKEIEKKLKKLPYRAIPEVMDYIDSLLKKYSKKEFNESNFKFDWEGGLSNLKTEYTSVELQHKSLEWR